MDELLMFDVFYDIFGKPLLLLFTIPAALLFPLVIGAIVWMTVRELRKK